MRWRRSIYAFSMMLLVVGLLPAETVAAADFDVAEAESGDSSGAKPGSAGARSAAVAAAPVKNYESQLFNGTTPTRILDTRPTGVTHDGLFANTGAFAGTRTLQVTGRKIVPADAGAVVINVTVTNPVAAGYTTVFPTGTVRPNASSLNFVGGATVPNAVIAKLSPSGSLSIYNMAKADVIVDVSGWIPRGADYTALDPARLTDTRPARRTIDGKENGGGAYVGARTVDVVGRGGVRSTGVGSVVLNVTSTNQATAGYVTVYPTGGARPTTSNVNFVAGRDKASLVISKVAADGTIQLFNSTRSDVVVDVVGWFPLDADYTGLKPARLVDTRPGRSTIDGRNLADGAFAGTRSYQVPGRAGVPTRSSAVVLNVTVTESVVSGYTTAFAGGLARPLASNLNFGKGQTTSNLVVATVGLDGEISIYNSSPTHLVVDVFGWLPGFVPVKDTPATTQISLSREGVAGLADSIDASVSGDGRFTAYASKAASLVAGDTNGFQDIFVHDAQTRQVTRVSVSSAGDQADRASAAPKISADGRYVVFESVARNLVAGDTNNSTDVFVHDRDTATTTRVSVGAGGVEGNDHSRSPSVSDDGRYIAFASIGSNLVAGDLNNTDDVFVRDMVAGTTTRESVSSVGVEGDDASTAPVISGDGASLVFESFAENLVAGDSNAKLDIFRRDRVAGNIEIISRSTAGALGDGVSDNADVSNDGLMVSFRSAATNLVAGDTNTSEDIFVRDVTNGTTRRVSVDSAGAQASGLSNFQAISGNGRYVTFSSTAPNLVPGDINTWEDVFVGDLQANSTSRVSIGLGGVDANSMSYKPTISSNGRYVAFGSDASNLVDSGDGSAPQIYKALTDAGV